MKVLFFDLRESEKEFFDENNFNDLEFNFFCEPLSNKTKLDISSYNNTDVISVNRSSVLTSDVLEKFRNLRLIVTRSFGVNHIDLNYCKNHKIAVLNVEQYGNDAVCEFVLGLIITLTRHIKISADDVRYSRFCSQRYESKLLKEFSIGIIGSEDIGVSLAKLVKNFGMSVNICAYKDYASYDSSVNAVSFDKLLSESDIIFLCLPFCNDYSQIIGRDEFKRMKQGAYIINISSSKVLDIKELYNNLKSGKLSGAALDAPEFEYLNKNFKKLNYNQADTDLYYKYFKKLMDLNNVIITPYISYDTSDTAGYVLQTTINNIKDFCKGMSTNRVC